MMEQALSPPEFAVILFVTLFLASLFGIVTWVIVKYWGICAKEMFKPDIKTSMRNQTRSSQRWLDENRDWLD